MMKEFAVAFSVMKGLGPAWTEKVVFVGLDDLDPELEEVEIKDMAIAEAKAELGRKGITRYVYKGICAT